MRPTDDAIVLAALLNAREWQAADEIRGSLVQLGFEATAQQVGAWLRRLLREDCPMFEARPIMLWESFEYRVTRFGRTQLGNRFKGVWAILKAEAPTNPEHDLTEEEK